jgi:hypothetical protein
LPRNPTEKVPLLVSSAHDLGEWFMLVSNDVIGSRRGFMNKILQEIIDLLDVEPIEENLFRGQNHNTEHVFGGQVLAQALASAFRTVDGEQSLHSLHSYFLRAGDWTRPILYEVDRIRDGSQFQHAAGGSDSKWANHLHLGMLMAKVRTGSGSRAAHARCSPRPSLYVETLKPIRP